MWWWKEGKWIVNNDSLGFCRVAGGCGVIEETWRGLERELLLSLVLDVGAAGGWLKRSTRDEAVVSNGDGEMDVLLLFFTFSS
jgi:hypothetical protein